MSIARFRSRFPCKRIHTTEMFSLCLLFSLCTHQVKFFNIDLNEKQLFCLLFSHARIHKHIRCVCALFTYEFMAVYRNNSSKRWTQLLSMYSTSKWVNIHGASMEHLFLSLATFWIFRLYIMIISDGNSYIYLIVKSLSQKKRSTMSAKVVMAATTAFNIWKLSPKNTPAHTEREGVCFPPR